MSISILVLLMSCPCVHFHSCLALPLCPFLFLSNSCLVLVSFSTFCPISMLSSCTFLILSHSHLVFMSFSIFFLFLHCPHVHFYACPIPTLSSCTPLSHSLSMLMSISTFIQFILCPHVHFNLGPILTLF